MCAHSETSVCPGWLTRKRTQKATLFTNTHTRHTKKTLKNCLPDLMICHYYSIQRMQIYACMYLRFFIVTNRKTFNGQRGRHFIGKRLARVRLYDNIKLSIIGCERRTVFATARTLNEAGCFRRGSVEYGMLYANDFRLDLSHWAPIDDV